jgi:diguanylate cyclase (GGDEF)-like protein/PAS domain S-box-containing protein
MVLLATVRIRNDRDARAAVAQKESVVAALEAARTNLIRESIAAIGALHVADPSSFLNSYQDAQAALGNALAQAQGALIDANGHNGGSALSTLSLGLSYLHQDLNAVLAPATGDPHSPVRSGAEYATQFGPRLDQALVGLDGLTIDQQADLAAARSAADHESNVTLALLLSWALGGLLVAAGVMALIVASITRPLGLLRLRMNEALTTDSPVSPLSGPDEVAGLALDIDNLANERRNAEKSAVALREKYGALFSNSIDAVYVHDLEGKFIDANDAALELLGCTRDALVGAPIVDFFEEPRRPEVVSAMNAVFNNGRSHMQTFRLKSRDGRSVDVEVAASLVHNDDGVPFVLGVARDVSYRARAEEVLKGSEDKYREIFENVQDIYYRTDAQGIITDISPSVRRWGYSQDDLIDTNVLDVYVDPKERSGLLHELLSHEEVSDYEVKLRAADGSLVYASVGSRIIRGPAGEMIAVEGTLRDITKRKLAEEALREQMRRDPLTGVLNHAAIVGELRDIVSRNGAQGYTAVLMMDIDDLKAINDTFGHAVGDRVLASVAELLSKDGAMVGRYGDDEFIAVLPDTGHEEAQSFKTRFLSDLDAFGHNGDAPRPRVPISVSAGIAIHPLEASRVEEIIQLADSAMRAEKRRRRQSLKSGALRRDRNAARIVGEIVPYLTSSGDLDEKLRLVARRLSVAGAYDSVSFMLLQKDGDKTVKIISYARGPDRFIEEWNSEETKLVRQGKTSKFDPRHDRPHIINDLANSPRYSARQRELMSRAGLKSGLSAPMRWRNEIIGVLGVASQRENAFTPNDAQILSAVASQVTAIVCLENLVEDLQTASGRISRAHAETVMLLAAAAEAHDRTTGKHLKNVQKISEQLALELGYGEAEARELGLAAVLHDMGKIRVADSVLANTGRLTAEEWDLMQKHAVWGEQFLAGRTGFELAARIARSHHERWDGTGYPDSLKDQQISEAATIVSVADSFDAMTNDRPYKPGRSTAAAMQEIMACSGSQFNPKVVQALMRLYKARKLPSRRVHRVILDERQAA